MDRWKMRTGTICQYLWWNGNGPLFFIPRTPVFSRTLGDISLISHVLYMCGKLLRQDIASTCPPDKGKAWWLPDRWVTRTCMGRKQAEGSGVKEQKRGGKKKRVEDENSQELLWTWVPLGKVVSVNLGLIHVRVRTLSPWEASRRVIKFKWKLSWMHKWTDVTLERRTGHRCWLSLIFLWSCDCPHIVQYHIKYVTAMTKKH